MNLERYTEYILGNKDREVLSMLESGQGVYKKVILTIYFQEIALTKSNESLLGKADWDQIMAALK